MSQKMIEVPTTEETLTLMDDALWAISRQREVEGRMRELEHMDPDREVLAGIARSFHGLALTAVGRLGAVRGVELEDLGGVQVRGMDRRMRTVRLMGGVIVGSSWK